MRKKGAPLKKETLPFHKRPAAARLAARSQLYNDRRAAKPGQQNVLHVRCSEPKRGSAKARVAGEVFRIKGFAVYEQLYALLRIVHQPQNGCRPRRAVQQLPKLLLRRKGEPRRSDLMAQILCVERLMGRHLKIW